MLNKVCCEKPMNIYLDNNATTTIIDPVRYRQEKALKETYGNPSNPYAIGVVARRELENARQKIADLIGADITAKKGDRILFTGCATESNNAVFNSVRSLFPTKKHIIVSSVEHPSVLEVAKDFEESGYEVSYVPVSQNGELDIKFLEQNLRSDTVLVSIMTANNETGVIFPIDTVVKTIRSISADTFIHTDAVQAAGKIPIDVQKSGVDFLSLSGHKFHAPKGVGALYIRAGVSYKPFLLGGHQEKGLRAGTENTASIIAMGEAAIYARAAAMKQTAVYKMRDDLERAIQELPIRSMILGAKSYRISNTSNIAFSNVDGFALMLSLAGKNVFVATGSACSTRSQEPSHVVKAMHVPSEFQSPIRISLSNETKQEEIDIFLAEIENILLKKRN